LAPLTNIDIAANAIFPLTALNADSTQTAKNSEQTISVYQDTLTKMYREVEAQRESIRKSDELIHHLAKTQAGNKKLVEKNMEEIKKYSAGLVTIVTQYTQSLDMMGSSEGNSTNSTHGGANSSSTSGNSTAQGTFMEKLAQLRKHALLGLKL